MDAIISPFDAPTASREAWTALHRFRRIRHEERDPGDPILDDHAYEVLLASPDSMEDAYRFTASAPDGEVIGWLEFEQLKEGSPSHAQNPDLAWVWIEVLAPHRRRGIGVAFLERAAALARRHWRPILGIWTEEADGTGFLKHLDARFVQSRRESRLLLEQVDWDLLRRWVREGPTRSPGTSLRWFTDGVDDDLVAPFAEVFTEVFNQQPFGEATFTGLTFTPKIFREHEARTRDAGGTLRTVISHEPDGEISGLTEMTYFPNRPTMINQGLTGVRDRYRGRGLGKWLKAAMLLRIRDELPEVRFVSTGNASSNAAMLAINERLGFRKHKESWLVELDLDAVERYLASRAARQPEVA